MKDGNIPEQARLSAEDRLTRLRTVLACALQTYLFRRRQEGRFLQRDLADVLSITRSKEGTVDSVISRLCRGVPVMTVTEQQMLWYIMELDEDGLFMKWIDKILGGDLAVAQRDLFDTNAPEEISQEEPDAADQPAEEDVSQEEIEDMRRRFEAFIQSLRRKE